MCETKEIFRPKLRRSDTTQIGKTITQQVKGPKHAANCKTMWVTKIENDNNQITKDTSIFLTTQVSQSTDTRESDEIKFETVYF